MGDSANHFPFTLYSKQNTMGVIENDWIRDSKEVLMFNHDIFVNTCTVNKSWHLQVFLHIVSAPLDFALFCNVLN